MISQSRVVQFCDVSYDLHVRSGIGALADFADIMAALKADRFLIVADDHAPLSLRRSFADALAQVAPTTELLIEASEQHKTLATVDRLAEAALSVGATRGSCIVAMGGGVVGNIAGLLAALLFRGIRLVHVPTTFLAMSDSVLSTKQGVNSRQGKNHLGAFHPPTLVWNQLEFLETLPADEMRAAMCETIKNALAIKHEQIEEIEQLINERGKYSHNELARLLDFCIAAKMTVMAADVYEKHAGLVLEYGHTVGHALESLSAGRLRHGYAVGLGMLAAARLSVDLGYMAPADEELHHHLLAKNGAPVRFDGQLTRAEVLNMLRKDNKRGYLPPIPGRYDFVLLERPGTPRMIGASVLSQVKEGNVSQALRAIAVG